MSIGSFGSLQPEEADPLLAEGRGLLLQVRDGLKRDGLPAAVDHEGQFLARRWR